jgi:ABC-type polysaccharide/polyol phosphate export permease
MATKHESYRHLIWTLAKTDFTLRYHGSILGYAWAVLKPLMMFTVMYFVFSSIFNPRNTGNEFYAMELLIGILMFTFFAEGTGAGMSSLLAKAQLVTKIFVPRWCIIVSSTIHAAMVYTVNLSIIVIFAIIFQFTPSVLAVGMFILASLCLYLLIVSFALITAPLFVKFRDLSMIWEVVVSMLFYASPIIYPLTLLPESVQQIILINPVAFLIHFTKESLVNNHFADPWQLLFFLLIILALFGISILSYRKFSSRIAEDM